MKRIYVVANHRPPDPASRLKLAREAKGLSPRQIAEATKLSVRTIEALENHHLKALPSGVYRRSIVRAVAREVGLDPDHVLRELSSAYPDDLPPPECAQLQEPGAPVRASIQRLIAIAGAVVPMVAGIGYFTWSRPAVVIEDAPIRQRAADVWRPEVVPAGGFLAPSSTARRPVVLTIAISSRCQLRVTADGREVLGRIVEAGETVPVEMGDEVILSGDNAAAVQFSINGQAGRVLGAPGEPLSVRIGRDDYDAFLVRR